MARKEPAKKKPARRSSKGADGAQEVSLEARIVAATLTLAAREPWSDVSLKMIARAADLGLADLIAVFPDKTSIVRAFMRQIDQAVVAGLDPELDEENAHERLLDILIARLEAMTPHKEAVASIWRASREDVQAMLSLAPAMRRSMRVMMAAADIDADGLSGMIKVQGLMLVFARGVKTWLHDDDPGMARTMAQLDRGLRDGGRMMDRMAGIDKVARFATSFVAALRERRSGQGGEKTA